ncbi:MAG: MarR family winged helix-turn-helix transcriptional regulator [Gemmataceae bacterium]
MATGTGSQTLALAQDLFEVLTQISLSTQPHQRRGMELKELEFLTLSILHSHQPMIVGNIQRLLGVLPAQMSRIIRALENREPPLISCEINTRDKRKVDVHLTDSGEQALLDYQEARVGRLASILSGATDEDQEDLTRLIDLLNNALERSHGPINGAAHANGTHAND